MNQTRSQRIHRGFHRIGAVLAGIIILGALVAVAIHYRNPVDVSVVVAVSAAAAVAIYTLFRAIGWIIAGFLRD